MIDISFLYYGRVNETVGHRYGVCVLREGEKGGNESQKVVLADETKRAECLSYKPVVVWNVTRVCNLLCRHCYNSSGATVEDDELTRKEAMRVIDDLSAFGVRVILFSGGEPLMREDIFELIAYAKGRGIRTVLSTNGTLIDEKIANKIVDVGVSYVGVSIDSADASVHDRFRNCVGAFEKSVRAINVLKVRGQKTGLRVTLTRLNFGEISEIFALADRLSVDRVCFYHLVPVARADKELAMSNRIRRAVVERIIELTGDYPDMQVLTVDNHCDGAFLYLRLRRDNPERAEYVYELLKRHKGAGGSSGTGIACIDWIGNVYPDQFSMDLPLGNVREKSFQAIWGNDNEKLREIRNSYLYVKGRCKRCKFFDICGGGLRSRAKALTGDFRASEPDCYLSDSEISEEVK